MRRPRMLKPMPPDLNILAPMHESSKPDGGAMLTAKVQAMVQAHIDLHLHKGKNSEARGSRSPCTGCRPKGKDGGSGQGQGQAMKRSCWDSQGQEPGMPLGPYNVADRWFLRRYYEAGAAAGKSAHSQGLPWLSKWLLLLPHSEILLYLSMRFASTLVVLPNLIVCPVLEP